MIIYRAKTHFFLFLKDYIEKWKKIYVVVAELDEQYRAGTDVIAEGPVCSRGYPIGRTDIQRDLLHFAYSTANQDHSQNKVSCTFYNISNNYFYFLFKTNNNKLK